MAERIKLGDVISDIAAGPFGSNLKISCFVDDGFPIVDGANLKGYKLTDNITKYVTEEKARSLSRSIAKRNDVVVTISGTLGQIAYIPMDSRYDEYLCSQRQFRVTFDTEKVYVPYIVFYFHTYEGQHKILSFASQVGVPALSQPLKNFKLIDIDLPDIRTQKRIASIIETINSKIESNNAINKNLLQQIETLYKAWFVDYEPFNGLRPSTWKKKDIYSIAQIVYGAPFSSKLFNTNGEGIPIIRIRDLKEQKFVTYTTERHPKGRLLQPGDIVVGMDGEFRPYIWGNSEAWLNQRVCIFESLRPKGKAFLLFSIKPLLNIIEQTQVGTTVIHIGKKDFDSFEIDIPDINTLEKFDELTYPMIEQIVISQMESRRLSQLRDALLPRLMSGELDVSEFNV